MYKALIAVFIGLGVVLASPALAQEKEKEMPAEKEHHDESAVGHSHKMSEVHGGSVVMTEHHHFETLFTPEEIRIYAYTDKQAPINELKDVEVSLTLQSKKGDPRELSMKYVAPDLEEGRSQGYFEVDHDLGKIEQGMMKATFSVSGLGEEAVTFKTPVVLSHPVMYACPMHPEVTGSDPVSCSKCGMALTKSEASQEQHHEGHGHDHEGHNH